MAAAKKRSPTRQSRKAATAAAPRKKRSASSGIDNIVARETAQLEAQRAQIAGQLKGLNAELGRIDMRLQSLKLAKAALEGKSIATRVRGEKAAGGGSTVGNGKTPGRRQRRGGISEQVLAAITSGKAATRADLIQHFGYANDKPGQVSISNALSQLNAKKLIKSGKGRGEWITK